MIDIKKEVAAIRSLTASLNAANDQLEITLYDLRYNNGLCVECGVKVENEGEEYCDKCYQEGMAEVFDEHKHLDQRS